METTQHHADVSQSKCRRRYILHGRPITARKKRMQQVELEVRWPTLRCGIVTFCELDAGMVSDRQPSRSQLRSKQARVTGASLVMVAFLAPPFCAGPRNRKAVSENCFGRTCEPRCGQLSVQGNKGSAMRAHHPVQSPNRSPASNAQNLGLSFILAAPPAAKEHAGHAALRRK